MTLTKEQFELWAKQNIEQFCEGFELGKLEGYNKALKDVEQKIDEIPEFYLDRTFKKMIKNKLEEIKGEKK